MNFLPDNNLPIHANRVDIDPHWQTKNAILDLLTLAMSVDLHIFKVYNNAWGDYSGFSKLAYLLNKDRKNLELITSRREMKIDIDHNALSSVKN